VTADGHPLEVVCKSQTFAEKWFCDLMILVICLACKEPKYPNISEIVFSDIFAHVTCTKKPWILATRARPLRRAEEIVDEGRLAV
jgi:hypothetical protein